MKRSYTLLRLFLLFPLLFLLHACSKQGADNNEYVIREERDLDGNLLNKYEYNDRWQVTTHVRHYFFAGRWYMSTTNFFYNAAGQVERRHTKNTRLSDYRGEYTYDNQGRLILLKDFIPDGNVGLPILPLTSVYSYNGNEIIETASHSGGVFFTITYTLDDNGNIVKKVTDNDDQFSADTIEEYLDYDNQKNAGGPVAGNITSKNNYRKYIYTSNLESYTTHIKYAYNNAGYVTKRMVFKDGDPKMAVSKYTLIPKK